MSEYISLHFISLYNLNLSILQPIIILGNVYVGSNIYISMHAQISVLQFQYKNISKLIK